jgi:enamine deaminase RidA (YjgF/YER057c/UK114 family)
MDIATLNPADGIYTPTDDYVHGIEVRGLQRLVFVAGTMGLRADGEPGRDLDEQLELVWGNIGRILAEAGMTVDNIVRVTSYLRDAAHADRNGEARVQALAGRIVPTTAVVVETISPGWLVEIEVVAAA